MLTFDTYGGLGGQLLGLSYALVGSEELDRPVHVRFHTGGVSKRPLAVGELLKSATAQDAGVSFSIVDDYPRERSRALQAARRLVRNIRNAMSPSKPTAEYSLRILTLEELLEIDDGADYPDGALLDWRVAERALPWIECALRDTTLPNFLRPGTSNGQICVHWRLGDYLYADSVTAHHGVTSLQSLEQALANLESEAPRDGILIFTDSPDIARKALADSPVLREAEVVSGNIWGDLYEMSRARTLIANHSSISMWAALSLAFNNRAEDVLMRSRFTRSPDAEDILWPTSSDGFDFYEVGFCSESEIKVLRALGR
jgi:hypothetical protein